MNNSATEQLAITTEPSWVNQLDFLWLELTNRCNLRCSHCYAESGPYEPDTARLAQQDWIRILREGKELGCRKVQFIGGEPLLHHGLAELIVESRSLDYEFIEVYTNGTRLPGNVLQFFCQQQVNLAISLYSMVSEVHDTITKVKGSQRKTVQALKAAVALGIPVRVGIIEMDENKGATSEVVDFLKSIGIDDVRIDRARGVGRGHKYVDQLDPYKELCGACWRGQLAITSAGEVYPCVFSRFMNLGFVHEGLSNILARHELHNFRKTVHTNFRLNESDMGFCGPNCSPGSCSPGCSPMNAPCNPAKGCSPYNAAGVASIE